MGDVDGFPVYLSMWSSAFWLNQDSDPLSGAAAFSISGQLIRCDSYLLVSLKLLSMKHTDTQFFWHTALLEVVGDRGRG